MDERHIVEQLRSLLRRPADTHKYDYGHVLVVGGSAGMTGAPILAATAALRTGAGLVTVASSHTDQFSNLPVESMTLALPKDTAQIVEAVQDYVSERKVSVAAIGSGLNKNAAVLVRALTARLDIPVILDGGGITAFRGHLDDLHGSREHPVILTPHAGEFASLRGTETAAAAEQRLNEAVQFAREHHLTLCLKGQPNIVASRSGIFALKQGNPGMATAGSGDVLTGITAGLLAQKLSPFEAVCAGMYLHGSAGNRAASVYTQPGMVASDIIKCIPAAYSALSTLR